MELRESLENLHLQLEGVERCDRLVVNTETGRKLAHYDLRDGDAHRPYTANYTLSREMWRALGRGKLILNLTGGWLRLDQVSLRVNYFGGHLDPDYGRPYFRHRCGGHSETGYTGFARTNSCRCAYYVRGEFIRHAKPWEEDKCR